MIGHVDAIRVVAKMRVGTYLEILSRKGKRHPIFYEFHQRSADVHKRDQDSTGSGRVERHAHYDLMVLDEAILCREPKEAESLMRAHVSRVKTSMIRTFAELDKNSSSSE
jgi:DNA-binding GntR family transcriptional regulator